MTIYLFGVSNVGKTTTGELLAEKLGFVFYDLDEEVKKYFNVTLEEFVNTGTLEERDQKRAEVLEKIAGDRHNKVVAVTPIAYMEPIHSGRSEINLIWKGWRRKRLWKDWSMIIIFCRNDHTLVRIWKVYALKKGKCYELLERFVSGAYPRPRRNVLLRRRSSGS